MTSVGVNVRIQHVLAHASEDRVDGLSQVLRWSALAYGVGYGFTHQRTVYSADAARQEKQDYAKKEHRLEEAKQAWLNKVNPPKGDGGMCYTILPRQTIQSRNCQRPPKLTNTIPPEVH